MANTMGPARDLGPAIVAWGATTIEEIFDEVRLTLTGADPGEVFEALYGATPVDSVMLGYSACSITIPATRIALATLATLMPGATHSGAPTGWMGVKPKGVVGISMYDNGLPLFVKPIVAGAAAANGKWLRLERTYPNPNFDIAFNLRDQRVYGFTFKAHPSASVPGCKGGDGLLWSAGKVATATAY